MANVSSINGNPIILGSDANNTVSDDILVQTDGALSGYFAEVNDTLPMKIIKNQYVNNIGNINNYNGWDRTDYVNVKGLRKLKVISEESSEYNIFYDAEKAMVPSATGGHPSIVAGENVIDVPPNAVYAIFSGPASCIASLSISALETEDSKNIERQISLVQTDLYGRQVLIFKADDIKLGVSIDSQGNEITNNAAGLTIDYWPIAHAENEFEFECPGFRVYFVEYTKKQDGTYSIVKVGNYIDDNGTFWPSTGTTHIRMGFRKIGTNINETLLRDFCDVFVLREVRNANKYIRVCTFNMARDWPSLHGADAAGIQAQIYNYLNFIGQYDPDVIQAQEAGSDYWDDSEETKNMNETVFNRKYPFFYWPMHNRKTWSKYNISEPTFTTYAATYQGKTRSYTKMFLHFDGKEICLLNAHCEYEGTFEECRKLQFQELAAEMAQHEYCILCGDFNAYAASEFDVFSNFNRANCSDYGQIETWYVGEDYPDWPFRAIDNIITTKNIRIQNVVRGPYDKDNFSDHAPLLADLQIR